MSELSHKDWGEPLPPTCTCHTPGWGGCHVHGTGAERQNPVCSDCWFANGDGVSEHCGRCRCCVPRAGAEQVRP